MSLFHLRKHPDLTYSRSSQFAAKITNSVVMKVLVLGSSGIHQHINYQLFRCWKNFVFSCAFIRLLSRRILPFHMGRNVHDLLMSPYVLRSSVTLFNKTYIILWHEPTQPREWCRLHWLAYEGKDVAVIMYSITSNASFSAVKEVCPNNDFLCLFLVSCQCKTTSSFCANRPRFHQKRPPKELRCSSEAERKRRENYFPPRGGFEIEKW
jgi:hypothetical protein